MNINYQPEQLTQQMVGEYSVFIKNNTRSKFTTAKNSTLIVLSTILISQKFSDTAVILAIAVSKCCTQDLPVVNTQGSSTGFLFTYHPAIPVNFFTEYFFSGIVNFGVAFSINLTSLPHHF